MEWTLLVTLYKSKIKKKKYLPNSSNASMILKIVGLPHVKVSNAITDLESKVFPGSAVSLAFFRRW